MRVPHERSIFPARYTPYSSARIQWLFHEGYPSWEVLYQRIYSILFYRWYYVTVFIA